MAALAGAAGELAPPRACPVQRSLPVMVTEEDIKEAVQTVRMAWMARGQGSR
jgi:hypothetical protein